MGVFCSIHNSPKKKRLRNKIKHKVIPKKILSKGEQVYLGDDLRDVFQRLFDWIFSHVPLKSGDICDQVHCNPNKTDQHSKGSLLLILHAGCKNIGEMFCFIVV